MTTKLPPEQPFDEVAAPNSESTTLTRSQEELAARVHYLFRFARESIAGQQLEQEILDYRLQKDAP